MKEDPDTKLNREMETIFREKGLMADQGGFVHANAPVGAKPDTPTHPAFKLSGSAEVKHINVRKEGPEDDKELATDIKLLFTNVDRRLCRYFDEALEDFLWRADGEAMFVRNLFCQPVTYSNTVKAIVRIAEREFNGCEAKKFAFMPKDGGVMDVVCSVTLYPTAIAIGDLSDYVQDSVQVSIESEPDLFDKKEVAS